MSSYTPKVNLAISEDSLLQSIKESLINFNEQRLIVQCQKYLEFGFDPNKAVFTALVPGMMEVGQLYEEQIYFIPEMLFCAETLYAGLKIFKPHMTSDISHAKGNILIGVVEGDVHDIGKNLVKLMFEISGYAVTDLGRDVPTRLFIETALSEDFDLICVSSMMTTTMYEMKSMIKNLKEKKPDLKIMIGGSPVKKLHAIKWNADGYASSAQKAVVAVQQLLNTAKLIQDNI